VASLAQLAATRRQQLRALTAASQTLDSAQEALEREIKRLLTRKRAIPESSDAIRLAKLAQGTENALQNMVGVINTVATSWASF
jgi:prefoldin subunit 5